MSSDKIYGWLIDFKDISTSLGLFYALKLRNLVQFYVHIPIFV